MEEQNYYVIQYGREMYRRKKLIFQAVHSNIDRVMMTETSDRDHVPVRRWNLDQYEEIKKKLSLL